MDHKILVDTLHFYCIKGKALNLFIYYLNNKSQLVKINDTFSDSLLTKHEVPQGSVLGSIRFIIYVNDFHNLKTNDEIISYTEDTVVLFKGNNSTQIYSYVILYLKKIKD